MLVRELQREPLRPGAVGLDLCTGSGVLAIAAARHGCRHVAAVDISRRAVAAAWCNARLNGVSVQSVRGDLFEPVRGRRFDLIVSNPPYVPTPAGEIPRRGLARAWEGGAGRPRCSRSHLRAGRRPSASRRRDAARPLLDLRRGGDDFGARRSRFVGQRRPAPPGRTRSRSSGPAPTGCAGSSSCSRTIRRRCWSSGPRHPVGCDRSAWDSPRTGRSTRP